MDTTAQDIEDMLRTSNTSGKIRFLEYREQGQLVRLASAQGHSEFAQSMIAVDDHLTRATVDDPRFREVMLHGTKIQYCDQINREGLRAGGNKGRRYRTHIHLVETIEGSEEVAGVRGGSDAIVVVDIGAYMRDGGECWWSANGVLLTEGPIRPRYFLAINNRNTGRPVVPLPTPQLDAGGRPVEAEDDEPVAEIIVTKEEADRVRRRIAFTIEEQVADFKNVQEKFNALAVEDSLEEPQSSQLSAPRVQPAAGASRSSRDGASQPERKDIAGSCQRR
jgi:RNA:NAD 2'-phosphotransferase (TPT1/KptA family)